MEGLRPLFRYFELSGRSGRAEYWKFIAYVTMASLLLLFLELSSRHQFPVFMMIISILTAIPQWTATVRRLHDTDRSGWVLLWAGFAMMVGGVILGAAKQVNEYGQETYSPLGFVALPIMLGAYGYIIYLLCKAGDEYENRFGEPDNEVPASFVELTAKFRNGSVAPVMVARPIAKTGGMEDALAQIERLGQLRDKGLLSEEEFTVQKASILSRV